LTKISDTHNGIYGCGKVMRQVHRKRYEWKSSQNYADAATLLDLIFSNDLRLVYIRAPCNTYPPTTRITAFSGLEKVIIRLTCGGARLLPTIITVARGMHANSALLYPLHNKTNSVTNDSSKTIALSINLGLPNGIAIKPTVAIENKTTSVAR
jgi:hypothetical protein